jgi:hypothetical protein
MSSTSIGELDDGIYSYGSIQVVAELDSGELSAPMILGPTIVPYIPIDVSFFDEMEEDLVRIEGTGDIGANVSVYSDGEFIGSGSINPYGRFSILVEIGRVDSFDCTLTMYKDMSNTVPIDLGYFVPPDIWVDTFGDLVLNMPSVLPSHIQLQYSVNSGIDWISTTSVPISLPPGVYTDGEIQVRWIGDRFQGMVARFGSIILPYEAQQLNINPVIDEVNGEVNQVYMISGIGSPGSSIQIYNMSSQLLGSGTADENTGYFEVLCNTLDENIERSTEFKLMMDKGFDYHYEVTVPIPNNFNFTPYVSIRVANSSGSIYTFAFQVLGYRWPVHTVDLKKPDGTLEEIVNDTYQFTLTTNNPPNRYLFINNVNTGVIPVPPLQMQVNSQNRLYRPLLSQLPYRIDVNVPLDTPIGSIVTCIWNYDSFPIKSAIYEGSNPVLIQYFDGEIPDITNSNISYTITISGRYIIRSMSRAVTISNSIPAGTLVGGMNENGDLVLFAPSVLSLGLSTSLKLQFKNFDSNPAISGTIPASGTWNVPTGSYSASLISLLSYVRVVVSNSVIRTYLGSVLTGPHSVLYVEVDATFSIFLAIGSNNYTGTARMSNLEID